MNEAVAGTALLNGAAKFRGSLLSALSISAAVV